MRRLEAVLDRLDARLEPGAPHPLAVALSGGGDSMALLHLARHWAQAADRRLVALTVDHRLQSASAGWAARCAELCGRLGVPHRTLAWEGDKPVTGLPAAARRARHALLADAARDAGARVILMGHTADDLLEAALMRETGSTVPDPTEWAPSPVWPQGRDVFVLRPLLGVSRADLRTWLRELGQSWLEDPANENPTYARARARASLSSPLPLAGRGRGWGQARPSAADPVESEMLADIRERPHPTPSPRGGGALEFASAPDARTLARAIACASGSPGPPRLDRVRALAARLSAGETLTASLGGARVSSVGGQVCVSREPGEFRRDPSPHLALPLGRSVAWDGRFELTARIPGLTVRPLAGEARRLPKEEQGLLKTCPAKLRGALPLVEREGLVTCPVLAQSTVATVRSLVLTRFLAAAGHFQHEAAFGRVAMRASGA